MSKRKEAQEKILDAIIKTAPVDVDGDVTLRLAQAYGHLHDPYDFAKAYTAIPQAEAEQADRSD